MTPAEVSATAFIVIDSQDDIILQTLEFIINVLGKQYFKIVFEKELPDQHSAREIRFPNEEGLGDGKAIKEVIIPDSLRSKMTERLCRLPVLHILNEPLVCYAGLSTVVRKMVHHVDKLNPRARAISLLGHQETCLKSYAEASNWTKFYETDLPNSAYSLFHPPSSTNDVGKRSDTMTPELRSIFTQLEQELRTAKNIPNHRKYHGKDKEKWISKLVAQTFEQTCVKDNITEYVNDIIDGLKAAWSPYLTGFQMTVADLISFSIIVQMLLKLSEWYHMRNLKAALPLLFRWLGQMMTLSVVKEAMKNSWLSALHNIEEQEKSSEIPTSEVIFATKVNPVSQTKTEQKKQKIKVQHQIEIEDALQEIKELGISPEFSDLLHDQPEVSWNTLPSDLNPSKAIILQRMDYKGDLNHDRALRKQKQIENIMVAVKRLAKPGYRIVDFCAGGGHTGIVLAYFLPFCEVILVENKEQSVARALSRIQNLGLKNIKICHSNLDYFHGHFQIGISLHACGVATDLVLNTCLKNRASFVVCPCCYGSIRNIDQISYPRSKHFQTRMSLERYLVLSHSADMTSWDEMSERNQCAKSSMALIDFDRCLLMRESGYVTSMCIMQPPSCTPKNNLLIGEYLT